MRAVGYFKNAAGLEQCALGQREFGLGDLVGAVAGHEAAQLVAAPDVALVRALYGRRIAACATGHHHDVSGQGVHQGGVGLGMEANINGQAVHLRDQIVQQLAVFRVGHGGEKQGAAQAVAALDQRDLVAAQSRYARCLHAAGATAHHQHMARGAGRLDAPLGLVAGLGIDGAFDALVDKNLAHTGVAINARPDVLRAVLHQLDGDVRVGQHLARHGHKVELALGDGACRHLGLDAPGGDDRHRQRFFDGRRIAHKGARRLRNRRLREGRAAGQRRIGRDANRIGARVLAHAGGGHRLGQRDAARRVELLSVQAHPDWKVSAHTCFDRLQGLDQQAGAVF